MSGRLLKGEKDFIRFLIADVPRQADLEQAMRSLVGWPRTRHLAAVGRRWHRRYCRSEAGDD